MKNDKKWAAIKRLLDAEITGEIDLPEECLIIWPDQIGGILTRKRLELIGAIEVSSPETIKQLADHLGRKLPAVDRDVNYLKGVGIIKTVRNGKGVRPVLSKALILMPLAKLIA